MSALPDVAQAVSHACVFNQAAATGGDARQLVGYLVSDSGLPLDTAALKARLAEQLPPHMVARELRQVRYIAVASPAYLKGLIKPPKHPQELGREHGVACITLGYGDFQNRLQWVHGQDRSPVPAVTEVAVHSPLSMDSSTGIINLALQHQGIGLVADFAAQTVLAGVVPDVDKLPLGKLRGQV